ncbi:helix-turn-helix transcriptional regulator [Nocardia sp.]|uniref:helix-turn-helix transcriptional regulator n=1 Tax=Nocardia sp. TaxID=1821 RepID=UPI00260FEC71|nr:helix-turn-helix transcriptional regulator [Nocardia sp.]
MPTIRAGTLAYDTDHQVTGWHHHDLHQLEHAVEGVVEVETALGRYLCPPSQAVWIPAGLEHNTVLDAVRSLSVFFDPGLFSDDVGSRVRVLAAVPVLREMMLYGLRWPIARTAADADSEIYFAALALVVANSLDQEQPLWLPTSADPFAAMIISYIRQHLATVSVEMVAREFSVSERTLRRRFQAAVGMSWREYVLQARIIRAMAELAQSDAAVLDVAVAVGFDSPSAFNRAFRAFTGTTPSDYRRHTGCAAG